MSEDLIGKLARFTPGATGIDRDEWLFRAGRASAPSPRWWKRAVGLLVATQALTLTVWLGRPTPAPVAVIPPPSTVPAPTTTDEPPPIPSDPLPASSYLILSRTDLTRSLPPDPGPASSTTVRPSLTAGWRGGPID